MERDEDKEFLTDIRKKNAPQNPAVDIVARQLSPSMIFLRSSPYDTAIKESEAYSRSENNQTTKDSKFLIYSGKKLDMGANAHLGNYLNVMQKLGDRYSPAQKRTQTAAGNSDLYDQLLELKKSLCLRIASAPIKTKYIRIIYANDFPCIMVYVTKNSIVKPEGAKLLTEASHKAWVEFLISMFTGMINYYAYERNIHIELERRASFGFLTPTICETGTSFRISMGVVPALYADLVTETLHKLDQLIHSLHDITIKIPADMFYGKKSHEDYLGEPALPITNLLHILFVPVEKRSGLGVRNITRTSYARQGLSMAMFNKLLQGGSPLEGFAKALHWAVKKLTIKPDGYYIVDGEKVAKMTLYFDSKTEKVKYSQVFSTKSFRVDDDNFWGQIRKIIDNVAKMNKPIVNEQSKAIGTRNVTASKKLKDLYIKLEKRIKIIETENIAAKQIENLYYNLEMLNEIIFAIAVFEASYENPDDGHGSDSECESDIAQTPLYAKKIITHNGMRAIWCALIAAAKYSSEQGLDKRVFMKTAYYEVAKGLEYLPTVHNINALEIVNLSSEASILIHDLNACVTDGSPKPDYNIDEINKILMLDVTSATTAQVRVNLKRFAESRAKVLFLVDSGFKHQQLGADKNQYGTVRVVTKSKKTTDKLYEGMVKDEAPVLSMTSHVHRRKMKQLGAVPTNTNYMKIKCQ